MIKVALTGYKTWQAEVSVKAGSSESHPLVELVVADGRLDINILRGQQS